MIILDFSKVFDRVPNCHLLKKIHHYGIRGNTHKSIESFLFNRSQQVVAEGKTSETVPVINGVPQGSVLGPLLFLMFINDLPENFTSDTRLFADDAIVYRQIHSVEDQVILQNDLVKLAEYLGVNIQSNLVWNNHIDRVTKKSNNMLGFLRCNLRSASSETNTNAYITMVRSNLEYCVSAWNPHQKK